MLLIEQSGEMQFGLWKTMGYIRPPPLTGITSDEKPRFIIHHQENKASVIKSANGQYGRVRKNTVHPVDQNRISYHAIHHHLSNLNFQSQWNFFASK